MGKLIFENATASDVPEEIYDQIFKESLHRDEPLHVYKNELAECGWSFTKFAVGDRVKILGLKHDDSLDDPNGIVVSISPATYGMLNVCVRKDDGTETFAYPGDLMKLEPNE